jgi:hypothetical protein
MRKVSILVGAWLVSLFAAGMWAHAQAPVVPAPLPSPAPRMPPALDEPARVIAGNDLGFRVEDVRNNRIIGRFVVRVNGQWREVEEALVTKRLTER